MENIPEETNPLDNNEQINYEPVTHTESSVDTTEPIAYNPVKSGSNHQSHDSGISVTHIGTGLLVSIIILSVLAGAFGGVGGALYIEHHATVFGAQTSVGKNTVVQEDSAIIDVVKKASPAVVSIVISKDVSQVDNTDGSTDNPFFLDPFFQNRSSNGDGSSTNGNSGNSSSGSSSDLQEVGAGSGFFVSSDGLILTNKHVVSDTTAQYTVFTNNGKKYDATVLSRDPVNDMALVKINITNAPTLSLADSSKIQIGQRVIAIGNSLGQYQNTVTSGIVSGIGRDIVAGGDGSSEQLEGVIQTDAAINPGNSGGPLLDIDGDVIGMNTAIDQQGQLVGFAIPSNDAEKDILSFQKSGKITQPFLGVSYILITPDVKDTYKLSVDNGAWVKANPDSDPDSTSGPSVVAGSPAQKAGIEDGDIILSLNGKDVDQTTTLTSIIKTLNPGDTVTIQVLRGTKTLTLTAVLGER